MKKLSFGIVFSSVFIFVVALSWVINKNASHSGVVANVEFPKFTLTSFVDKSFQKQFESYIRNHFPSLSYWLYLKNDIYEIMNFGQFHAGYDGVILEGRNGVLYEAWYVGHAYDKSKYDNIEAKSGKLAQAVAELAREVEARGVQFAFVLAPAKPDCRREDLPSLWRWRFGGLPDSGEPYYAAYAQAMARKHVLAVNCLQPILNGDVADKSFPDRGTHWSMYAAGLCVQTLAGKLHTLDPKIWPQVMVTASKRVSHEHFFEEDLARLLNIKPSYGRGRDYSHYAEYNGISAGLPITVVGDSFANQLTGALKLSGLANAEHVYQFSNHIPPRESFVKAVSQSRLVLMIFTSPAWIRESTFRVIMTLTEYLRS